MHLAHSVLIKVIAELVWVGDSVQQIVNHGIWQNTNIKGVWLDESFQVKVGQQTGELTGMREMDCGFAGCER